MQPAALPFPQGERLDSVADLLCDPSAVCDADGHEARTRKRGAVLEDAIHCAAIAELQQVGYGGFSMESVAARAETGKASIYRRWPAKQLLVLDAVCSVAGRTCGAAFAVDTLPERLSTADALKEIGRRIVALMSGEVGEVMRSLLGEAARDPQLRAAIDREFHAPRKAAMTALFERGRRRGDVRADVRPELVSELLPAVLGHRILIRSQPVSGADVDTLVDQVILPLIGPK